jgi:hypothetical protein
MSIPLFEDRDAQAARRLEGATPEAPFPPHLMQNGGRQIARRLSGKCYNRRSLARQDTTRSFIENRQPAKATTHGARDAYQRSGVATFLQR